MSENKTAVRVIVSLIAIPLIVAVCYFGQLLFLLFGLAIGLTAFYEFSAMLKNKSVYVNNTAGYLASAALILNSYFEYFPFEYLLMGIAVIILLGGLRWKDGTSPVFDIGGTLTGVFYIGLFISALIGIREFYNYSPEMYVNGGYLIIAVMVSIWVCDSAAFFLGIAFGKHKLYPKVSPKKSWEGAIAGFVFSFLAMIAAKFLVLDFLSWETAAAIGLTVGIFGQAGDFVESLFKRDTGVKDSSALIPGHGGILDRFDSLIFSSPIIYLILLILEK